MHGPSTLFLERSLEAHARRFLMRVRWLWALLITICLILATAGVAWAHVVVSPEEAPADDFQKFVVSVPTEKDIPTTEVRVEVPEEFTVLGVQPVPGWDYEFEEDGGIIEAITWSGGEIGPREFQEFAFQARTPEETGEYPWRAFQTYEDGSVVEWTGPEDSEEPASVVRVVEAGTDEHGSEKAGTHSHSEGAKATKDALPKTGGTTTQGIVTYIGLGLGALALVVALRWRRSP